MGIALLEQIGLTKSEINVYEALLELGSSTTGPIVDKSRASSSKIYEILEKLIQKGLVSVVIEGGTKHFEAASPQRILDYLNEKKQQLSEQEEAIKKILPELELKKTLAKYKTEATLFRGLKGMETAFNDIFKTCKKGDAVCVYVVGQTNERIQAFFLNHLDLRAKKGIMTKTIYSEIARLIYEARKNIPYNEGKVISSALETPATVNIYGNKVLLRMGYPENLITIIINNKELATSFQQQFDAMWNQKTHTYEGVEQIRSLFIQSLSFGDYDVLAEGMKIVNTLGEDFFMRWQEEKRKRAIKSKGIISNIYRKLPTVTKSITDFKFVPSFENPGSTFIFKDKVMTVLFTKKPVAFLIESKEAAENQRRYFDLVWNQKIQTYEGFDMVTNKFESMLDELKAGDEYFVLGASYGFEQTRLREWFFSYHKKRIKKGIKVKLLSVPEDYDDIVLQLIKTGDPEMKTCQVKKLPPELNSPMQINLYKNNKVLFFVWTDQFTCFEIESDTLYTNFKNYFDTLWGRK